MKYAVLISFSLVLASCGYSLSSSPYGLKEPLTLSVPVAANQSPYANLGPRLTREVISRLDSSSNVTVREEAPATLRMIVDKVHVSGGAWNPYSSEYDLPAVSASRVVSLTVEAVLEKANAPSRRQVFSSHRNFYINDNENQTQLLEEEAFAWVVADLAQKIAQNLFSEF